MGEKTNNINHQYFYELDNVHKQNQAKNNYIAQTCDKLDTTGKREALAIKF